MVSDATGTDVAQRGPGQLADRGHKASRMAHEIRNPLNAMQMQVAVIRNRLRRPNGPDLGEALEQLELLEHELRRLDRLVQAFLHVGRSTPEAPTTFGLAELIDEVAELFGPELQQKSARLMLDVCEGADGLQVRMDRTSLHQVLLNILKNAEHATGEGGCVTIRVARHDPGKGLLLVEDDGKGIPADVLPHVFEPFFSTREDGEGLGLGLDIAKDIIETAGGEIDIESEVNQGTRVRLVLPVHEPAPV